MKLYSCDHTTFGMVGLWTTALLLSTTTMTTVSAQQQAQDCCLCDDCNVDALYGIEFGVDAPTNTGTTTTTTTTSRITDCGDLAANLLLNTKQTDPACTSKKYIYGPICCSAAATTTTTASGQLADDRGRDLQWQVVNYQTFGAGTTTTTSFRGGPAPTTPRLSSWWSYPTGGSVPRPAPTVQQWFVPTAPRPVSGFVPRPPPPAPRPAPATTNWGNSLPTSSASTSGDASSQAWITAHNNRRNTYHSQNRVSYVAVKWSEDLAGSARSYTQRLLNGFSGCQIQHKFQGDSYGGENLAMQITGSGTTSTSAESVLRLWYDGEIGLPYPQNGHLTQVVWRGTQYVGCAALTKNMGNGQICHIQTCRYLTPGNCNGVGSILAASTPCAPQCPREGCF